MKFLTHDNERIVATPSVLSLVAMPRGSTNCIAKTRLSSYRTGEAVKIRITPAKTYDAEKGVLAFKLDDIAKSEERTNIVSTQLWIETDNEKAIRQLLREYNKDQAIYVVKRKNNEEETNDNEKSSTLMMTKVDGEMRELEATGSPLIIDLGKEVRVLSACVISFWGVNPQLNMLVDQDFLDREWKRIKQSKGK